MIRHGERKVGLYYLNTHWKIGDPIPQALVTTNNLPKVDQIWLWNKRLGHPPHFFLEKMFLTLFGKTKSYDFYFKVCEFTKHHGVPFPIRNEKKQKKKKKKEHSPFSLIHMHAQIFLGRWFVIFINDYTHTTWVYFLKSKSEVNSIFAIFHKLVCTQFCTKIHTLSSDNGRSINKKKVHIMEGNIHDLVTYLQNEDIVHQPSCEIPHNKIG